MIIDINIGKIILDGAIYLFMALFIGLSQAAGIGGGPILNICLMLGFGYGVKQSMAITYLFLMGGSIASIYSNFGKRNKQNTKKLIDQNLVMITLPMTVSGSVMGTIFNHFISQFVITVAFTVLLSYLAYNSYQKYVQLKLNQQRRLISKDSMEGYELQQIEQVRSNLGKQNPELQTILKEEMNTFSKHTIINFVAIVSISAVAMLIKGGKNFDSILGFESCGQGSLITVCIHVLISYFYARYIAIRQQKIDNYKQSLGYVFAREEDKMSQKFYQKALVLGFAAGFTGGVLGIGGAIILVPAWLEMGIDRDVTSSSSSPLILSSALISSFVAALCDYYDSVWQVLFYLLWGYVASYYVKQGVSWVKERFRMQGMIFVLLIIVMVLSLVFLLPFEMGKMIEDPEEFFQFGHFC